MRRLAVLAVLSLALLGSALVLAGFLRAGPGKVGDVDVGEHGARITIDLAGDAHESGRYDPYERPSVLISPDGRWRAVLHLPGMSGNTGTVEIGRHDPDGPLRIVERHLFVGGGAVWSPDSRWLAIGVWVPHVISAIAVSTDGHRRLLARPFCGDFASGVAWEPHGTRIALGVPVPGTGCARGVDLRVQGVAAGRGRVIARGIEGIPSWSADGRWIATTGNGVEVLQPDGSHRWAPPASLATWAPRGHLLALVDGNDETLALGQAAGPVRTWDSHVQATLAPTFSPDGRLVAYARWDAIVVRRVADRSLVTEVPISAVGVLRLAWAADGRALVADAAAFRQSD